MSSTAQVEDINTIFSKVFGNNKNKRGNFKGQVLKGKRNGMGILSMKNGCVYIGDFYRNNITGYGILFASKDKHIENCNECFIYVGNFRDGKKVGNGRCYDTNGKMMYQGMFEENKPVNDYPKYSEKDREFYVLDLLNGNIFLGETESGNANGLGIMLFNTGDLWFTNFVNGKEKGIGLHLSNEGEWETVNFNNGNYDVISSSTYYRNIDIARKEVFRNSMAEVMETLPNVMNAAIDIAYNVRKLKNSEISSTTINNEETITNNSSLIDENPNQRNNKQGKSSDSDRDGKWLTANYSSQKYVYSNYESQLIKMSTNPSYYNETQKKDIQAKMKKIRETIVSHGGTCTKSQWETW